MSKSKEKKRKSLTKVPTLSLTSDQQSDVDKGIDRMASLALSPRVISIPQRKNMTISSGSPLSAGARLGGSSLVGPAISTTNATQVKHVETPQQREKKEFVVRVMEDILSLSGLPYYEVVSITEELTKKIEKQAETVHWKKKKPSGPLKHTKYTCLSVDELMAVSRIRDDSAALLKYSSEQDAATTIQAAAKGWLVRKRMKSVSRDRRVVHLEYSRAIFDVMNKEIAYLQSLQQLNDYYLQPLRKQKIISKKDINLVFSNVLELLEVQSQVIAELERLLEQWPLVKGIGPALLRLAPSLSVYGTFVSNFNNSQATIMRLKKDTKEFTLFAFDADREHGTSLAALLSLPVNHIAKFCGELKTIIPLAPNNQEQQELNIAVELFEEAGMRIKEALIGADSTQSIEIVQRRFSTDDIVLAKPDRVLLEEGEVIMDAGTAKNEKALSKFIPHSLFLFNDMLLIAVPEDKLKKVKKAKKKDYTLKVKGKVPLETMEVRSGTSDTEFIVISNADEWHCTTKSPEGKNMWQNKIQDLVESRDANKVFGIPLLELLEREGRTTRAIPVIVDTCVTFIRGLENGLQTEGIFRISGMKSDLESLRLMFNTKDQTEFDLNDRDIHAVAGTLLTWLRELPEPLLGFDAFDSMLSTIEQEDDMLSKLKENLKDINRRSPSHMKLFQYLCAFWCEVTEFAAISKMSPANIAIVVGPNILRPRVDTIETALKSPLVNSAIEAVIANYASLFSDFESWN